MSEKVTYTIEVEGDEHTQERFRSEIHEFGTMVAGNVEILEEE